MHPTKGKVIGGKRERHFTIFVNKEEKYTDPLLSYRITFFWNIYVLYLFFRYLTKKRRSSYFRHHFFVVDQSLECFFSNVVTAAVRAVRLDT